MKFAFSTLACPRWSIEQVIDHAVQLGYDGIELRLLDGEIIDPIQHADRVIEAVLLSRERGVDVCALDTSCTLNQSDAADRAAQVASLQNWIQLAHKTHVPILRVFGGQSKSGIDPQPTPQQEDAWVAGILRQVAKEAEQAGVTITLETHDAYSSARRVAKVLHEANSPAIGVLWDSHHPYRVGESAAEVYELLSPRIAHVHVKDAIRIPDTENWQLVLIGEGEVPVQEQLQILSQHGYNGYISVEWEKRWHPELAEPEIALPEHIAWLKRIDATLNGQ